VHVNYKSNRAKGRPQRRGWFKYGQLGTEGKV